MTIDIEPKPTLIGHLKTEPRMRVWECESLEVAQRNAVMARDAYWMVGVRDDDRGIIEWPREDVYVTRSGVSTVREWPEFEPLPTTIEGAVYLPPLDSDGTPRPDWVGLGRWCDAVGDVADFDRGVFVYPGGELTLSHRWSELTARAEGFTPETESAPKGDGFCSHGCDCIVKCLPSCSCAVSPGKTAGYTPETESLGEGGEGADDPPEPSTLACPRCNSDDLDNVGDGVSLVCMKCNNTWEVGAAEPEHCYALDGPRRIPETPDTRSTALVSVEGGRLRLHIDQSETHTGLLEDREKRRVQWDGVDWERVVEVSGLDWALALKFQHEWYHAAILDTKGWPTAHDTPAVQAIREAHRALEVALCEAKSEGAKRRSR